MGAGDVTSAIALFETLAKAFGASVAPILFALWIYFQKPKDKPIDLSPIDKLRSELIEEIKEVKTDVKYMRDRVAKIEGGLGL
jgi:hypothetical protein